MCFWWWWCILFLWWSIVMCKWRWVCIRLKIWILFCLRKCCKRMWKLLLWRWIIMKMWLLVIRGIIRCMCIMVVCWILIYVLKKLWKCWMWVKRICLCGVLGSSVRWVKSWLIVGVVIVMIVFVIMRVVVSGLKVKSWWSGRIIIILCIICVINCGDVVFLFWKCIVGLSVRMIWMSVRYIFWMLRVILLMWLWILCFIEMVWVWFLNKSLCLLCVK